MKSVFKNKINNIVICNTKVKDQQRHIARIFHKLILKSCSREENLKKWDSNAFQ